MRSRSGAAREVRARDGECGQAGTRGGAGAAGAQAGELGCLPAGSAACAASDWAGASGAAVGVGCWVRARGGRARAEMDGARLAPQSVTALPPAARPRLTLACRRNPGDLEQLCVWGERRWRRFNGGIPALPS